MSGLVFELMTQEDLNLGTGRVEVSLPTGGTAVARQINLSALSLYVTQTWDPGALVAGALEALTVTVTGAKVGDIVMATLSSILTASADDDHVVLYGRVVSDNTVRVIVKNAGTATVNLASGKLRLLVFGIPTDPLT